jgi:hypothetical protein
MPKSARTSIRRCRENGDSAVATPGPAATGTLCEGDEGDESERTSAVGAARGPPSPCWYVPSMTPACSSEPLDMHPPHPPQEKSGTALSGSGAWRVGSRKAATNPPHEPLPPGTSPPRHVALGLMRPADIHSRPGRTVRRRAVARATAYAATPSASRAGCPNRRRAPRKSGSTDPRRWCTPRNH